MVLDFAVALQGSLRQVLGVGVDLHLLLLLGRINDPVTDCVVASPDIPAATVRHDTDEAFVRSQHTPQIRGEFSKVIGAYCFGRTKVMH